MANLGNVWHIPANPEPRGRGAMRDPVGAVVAGSAVTIISGNQFRGPDGNPGNQLQAGSAVFFKKSTDSNWTSVPMLFLRELGNSKYYSAPIPANAFNPGDTGQYYLRIPTAITTPPSCMRAARTRQRTARKAPRGSAVQIHCR